MTDMKFETTILGCGSATPTLKHRPTSQLVEHNGHYLLFDCGEGTQLQLRKFSLKFQRINHIFITHSHGDHCLGLPGLISTMHLLGRRNPLHIFAPAELKGAVELQLRVSHSHLRFPVKWHPTIASQPEVLHETSGYAVTSFPLRHGVPCTGFKIEEKPKPRNIRPDVIEKYGIPYVRIRTIKRGADLVLEDGTVVPNHELTYDPDPPRSYAFCTDTAFSTDTVKHVRGVTTLYHESTFLEEHVVRAAETMHSTAAQAGMVAALAEVKQLVLGHYSARYRNLQDFLTEAKTEFPNVLTAEEGMTIPIG